LNMKAGSERLRNISGMSRSDVRNISKKEKALRETYPEENKEKPDLQELGSPTERTKQAEQAPASWRASSIT